MTEATPSAETIRLGFLATFSETEANRWANCVASLPDPLNPTPDDLGLALAIWATNLDDFALVRGVIDAFPLQAVHVVGAGETLNLMPSEAMESPVLRRFLKRAVGQALGAFLTEPEHRAALSNLSVRDDDTGASGVDLVYQREGLTITAYYGDAIAQSVLLTMRLMSGNGLRQIVGPEPSTEATSDALTIGDRPHGVGAIGPALEGAA